MNTAELLRMSDVQATRLEWLWPARFPLGKLSLLVGDPSLGKSLITTDMAARVSTGTPWPDCPDDPNPAGSVVLLTAEDDTSDTVAPRLMAAQADLHRVVVLSAVVRDDGTRGGFTLADLPALEAAIETIGDVRLLVIDPISAYMGGVDSHKNAEVRSLLAPLADVAQRYRIAVIAVSHLTKAYGGKAMYRAMGSLAVIAAARAGWAVIADPADPRHRGLLPVKMNLGSELRGLGYRITTATPRDDLGPQPIIAWEAAPVEATADEWLAAESGKSDSESPRHSATEWLRELLAAGPVAVNDVWAAAIECGHSRATVRRARAAVGVRDFRKGFGKGGAWYWRLADGDAPKALNPAIDAHTEGVSTYDENEHLCEPDGDGHESPPEPAAPEELFRGKPTTLAAFTER